jgi:hypothetical protein
MSPSLFQRWRNLVAEHSAPEIAALYVLHRLLQRLSSGHVAIVPYMLVAQPVGNPALADIKPDPGTVVRRIGPGDPVIASFPRPAAVNAQRFADGSECYVAWLKGEFAGHVWIARGSFVEDEVRCIYEIAEPATGVWDYDVYVEPRLRLGRTMARLWRAVDDDLSVQGVRWSFSRINRFNAASIRSHQRLGAKEVGGACFLVIGKLQLRWSGRQCKGTRWLASLPWRSSQVVLRA